jgi:hypothetical protein
LLSEGWGLPPVCVKCGAGERIAWRKLRLLDVPLCTTCNRAWARARVGAVVAVVLAAAAGVLSASPLLAPRLLMRLEIAAGSAVLLAFLVGALVSRKTVRAHRRRRDRVFVVRGVHEAAAEAWNALAGRHRHRGFG